MAGYLTTHVLDTARGCPAAGVPLRCERDDNGVFVTVAEGITNDDGRVADLLPEGGLTRGVWRMTFDTARYFASTGVQGFYPVVHVIFEVTAPDQHHHVPLLLSPFGYSTYRGS